MSSKSNISKKNYQGHYLYMKIFSYIPKSYEYKNNRHDETKPLCTNSVNSDNYGKQYGIMSLGLVTFRGTNMRDNEFIKIRDEFSKELEPRQLKSGIDCWNFYINSTDENMKKYESSEEKVYELYRDKDTYKKLLELEKEGLNDKHFIFNRLRWKAKKPYAKKKTKLPGNITNMFP